MGDPRNPEQCDVVTLFDEVGTARGFMVVWVDDDVVICDSGAKLESFTREEFESLFEKGDFQVE